MRLQKLTFLTGIAMLVFITANAQTIQQQIDLKSKAELVKIIEGGVIFTSILSWATASLKRLK